jgi:hypothetical protein
MIPATHARRGNLQESNKGWNGKLSRTVAVVVVVAVAVALERQVDDAFWSASVQSDSHS